MRVGQMKPTTCTARRRYSTNAVDARVSTDDPCLVFYSDSIDTSPLNSVALTEENQLAENIANNSIPMTESSRQNCVQNTLAVYRTAYIDGMTSPEILAMYEVMSSTSGYVTERDANVVANVTTSPPLAAQRPASLPGLVDRETTDKVLEAVNCYFLPVLFVLGVAGNALSVVVLAVHGLNSSTNVLLTGVTVSDLCYLVTMYIRKVSCIVSKFDLVLGLTLDRGLLPTVYMVHRIFGLTTPFLTMLITLERCLAVSMPLKVSEIVTAFRVKVAVTAIYLCSALCILPFFFIYEVRWIPNQDGVLLPVPVGTKFYYDNYDVISAYNNIALSGLFYFGPMAVVLVCTVFISITVRRSAQWRQATSSKVTGGKKEERKVTRLLMTVVVVYLGAYIPGAAIGIANQATPDFGSIGGRYNNLFYLVAGLQLLLYALRSSSNFVIYMLLSKKFLDTYRRIFMCKRALDRKQTASAAFLTSKTEDSAVGSCVTDAN